MDKKEIYEHLANIYLDASSKSSKKKRKTKTRTKSFQPLMAAGIVTILGLGSLAVYSNPFSRNRQAQTALFLYQDAAKLNFNFNPAKKESFSLNLNGLNLSRYKELYFSFKKLNSRDTIALRIEFTNRFNEKGEVYVKDIPDKWAEQRIDLKRFAQVGDWNEMKTLSFSVEEWNTKEKSGVVYIDNIRVVR
jgi:hypothetical protein